MTLSRAKHKFRKRWFVGLGILILALIYGGLCIFLPLRPLPSNVSSSTLKITTTEPSLIWPSYGEAAVGLNGSPELTQAHGTQTPLPTASVAKLITALAVLSKYPLNPGQQGPTISLDATDYGYYSAYLAEQGSVVPVYNGEQLSEYQMLEAMLVPSGNNIADSLARWAFGSLANYDSYANLMVKQLGMDNTHVAGDASGFLPTTTSTAGDLIILGSHVMANPLLKQIVGSKSVNVPNVGVLNNYDNILGVDGIIGIKTGNTNQAGGVFLGASSAILNGRSVTLLTSVMGASNLTSALNDTLPLVISLEHSFNKTIIINKGTVLGEYRQPWGGIVQIAAKTNLSLFILQGQPVTAKLSMHDLNLPSLASSTAGRVSTSADQFNQAQSIPVITLQPTTKPSLIWRLEHPQAEIWNKRMVGAEGLEPPTSCV